MKIALRDTSQQADGPDWEWIGTFEDQGSFREADGRCFELIDPVLLPASRGRNAGSKTYTFRTSELRGLAALVHERVRNDVHELPLVTLSDTFPYRSPAGACFACEEDDIDGDQRRESAAGCCRYCPDVFVGRLDAPELLKHNGGHILHDERLRDVGDACGLCLSSTNGCVIYLVCKGKYTTISLEKSKCVNLQQFRLGQAAKFTRSSPCTNHPMRCVLCPDNAPAVWKYNLQSHIVADHPRANVALYEKQYKISADKVVLMRGVYLSKPKMKKKKKGQLTISEGHSTRMAIGPLEETESTADDSEKDIESDQGDISSAEVLEGEAGKAAAPDVEEQEPDEERVDVAASGQWWKIA
ncbi:hypothetical protein CVT26_000971 [Gymnopilus dilepis]|uniref:Uncharacterized protein n=1 Tax=Gymnopilus dilepis TaxID=231916 RepID=A0A409X7X1_9AGAR|nr:hypothetical protein CVT26_000971 [Gymnopilus dilepis]